MADTAKPVGEVFTNTDPSGRAQFRVQMTSNEMPAETPAPAAESKTEDKPTTPEPTKDTKTEDKPAQDAKPSARPEWLPEKFAEPEAFKKSTVELATKLGLPKSFLRAIEQSESGPEVAEIYADLEKRATPDAGKPKDEAKPEDKKEEPKPEDKPAEAALPFEVDGWVKTEEMKAEEKSVLGEGIAAILDKAGVSGRLLGENYAKTGKINEASYKKFEAAGVTRHMLDNWMKGAYASGTELAEKAETEILDSVGGKPEFDKMKAWAAAGQWDADALELYNTMASSGNLKVALRAAADLKEAYEASLPKPPKKLVDGGGGTPSSDKYESWQELMADQATPAYQNGDKAFHAKVDRKLANSHLS